MFLEVRKRAVMAVVIFCALCAPSVPQAAQRGKAGEPLRLRLFPKFTAGQALYYELDFRSKASGSSVGLIANPQALKDVEISVSALVRLDVISVGPNTSQGARPVVRMRTTYEKLASTIRMDVPDPQADQLHDQIQRLEKKSLEFTIGADGKVSDIRGLEDIFPEQQTALREWLKQIGFTASLPEEGIFQGLKWHSEPPAAPATPLTGVVWKDESTYLRNEPCHAVKLTPQGKAVQIPNPESCAVILSALSLDETDKHSDRTPPEFREKNLRTNGMMSGKGESLTYISLTSGLVVSVTQTSRQEMDVTVSLVNGDSSLRYRGRVETQSQLSLVNDLTDSPVSPPQ
jgi:hypothetical protein